MSPRRCAGGRCIGASCGAQYTYRPMRWRVLSTRPANRTARRGGKERAPSWGRTRRKRLGVPWENGRLMRFGRCRAPEKGRIDRRSIGARRQGVNLTLRIQPPTFLSLAPAVPRFCWRDVSARQRPSPYNHQRHVSGCQDPCPLFDPHPRLLLPLLSRPDNVRSHCCFRRAFRWSGCVNQPCLDCSCA